MYIINIMVINGAKDYCFLCGDDWSENEVTIDRKSGYYENRHSKNIRPKKVKMFLCNDCVSLVENSIDGYKQTHI